MNTLARTVERLCEASRSRHASTATLLDWPGTLEQDRWFFSPELISLYGTEAYERLTDAERQRLSFFEAVNFFSLNIHGEEALIDGLARRLDRKDATTIVPYLHHFLGEESEHMACFSAFCTRYAGKIYPDRKIAFPRPCAEGEEDFLFFAKALVFEEIVDVYNVRMAADDRLVPVVREINGMHHRDETRHLAFGRRLVRELFEGCRATWSKATLQAVREYMAAYCVATWKEYYNPDIYRDAGFEDPYAVHLQTLRHGAARKRRREISRRWLRYFVESGILEEEPAI
jgi:hypothetical protein